MMRAHSIRWRLTLSYAAIACLAALASGAVLLGVLRGYYAGKERDYLVNNAESLRSLVSGAMKEDVPLDILKPQLENLAFISKVRIRVLDDQGQKLIDTGTPNRLYIVSFIYIASDQNSNSIQVQTMKLDPFNESAVISGGGGGGRTGIVQIRDGEAAPVGEATPVDQCIRNPGYQVGETLPAGPVLASDGTGEIMVNKMGALPLASTFYGFSVGNANTTRAADLVMEHRSNQQITSTLFDADHKPIGAIVLSDGPAYGSQIVNSVARGWLFAGGISILLAMAAGWFVSRQISRPLLALTEVTAHMTAGDLSTRAAIVRQDELGTLALSFNAMADRIQEIVITLQRFVADAAHELHTPLTALRTNLELARSEHPSPAICRAYDQAIRLEKLTDGLLALSRIEAHSDPTPTESVDLAGLIRSSSELYASRAEQAGLDYILSLPEQVPPVAGRADQLEVVLSNLVDNAIKFTPAGGTVSLGLHTVDHTLALVVQDTGIGIPPDDLPLLFERFRRAHNASDYPGSGLGLAITKAIVKAHGGSIVAESGDTGTQITVMLPLPRTP
jgi:signal transduction histidine kinase